MTEKKRPLGGLIDDAISSMDFSDQKPINIQTSRESLNADRSINAVKSGSDYSKKTNTDKNLKFDDDYVKWFSELDNKDVPIAGGKGASLSEMYNSKFPVPPGFMITAQAFDFFIIDLREKIKEILETVDLEDTEDLTKASKEIRKLIESEKMPKKLEEEIIEAYNILSSEKINKTGISQDAFNILKNSQEPIFVSVRSSATTEDLAEASFAGQQESFLNIKGERRLIENVKKCFSSLYTPRAIYYRGKKGFKDVKALLAVVIQKMVDSEKSGVVFSRDPMNLGENIVVEAVFGLGEGIVSGQIQPDLYIVSRDLKIKSTKISNKKIAIVRTGSGENEKVKLSSEKSKSQVLTTGEVMEIANYALKLEEHYKKPQDIEFALEGGKVYIVQSRPITTLKNKTQGKIISGNVILEGLGSSPGIGVGVVRIIKSMADLPKIKKGDILVTEMTNPDMVVAMQKSAAIVTDEGGITAHASIVSREMGIPCVVGTGNATSVLKDGMKITVDGSHGKVYEGEVAEAEKTEVKKAVETSRIKLKVIVDLPDFAERAAESGIDFIGLTRIEGIIANSKKHPLQYEKENTLNEYTKLLEKSIDEILKPFKGMWIRASDIRTDEYGSLEGAPEREINPMLGLHGIRFSLKHPKILEAELLAIKRVAERNPEKKVGIMFPQVISIEEVREVKKYFNKIKTKNMEFGAMVETPAAVQIIEEICDEVDFISFGTNDLTQFTLAVDRGEEDVQYLYNEFHPAVFSQIKKVIGVCRRKNVETSICGQAGSKKEMVEFLFKKGINSISVNADAAYEISNFIKQLEEDWEKNKDEYFKQRKEFRKMKKNRFRDEGESRQSNENNIDNREFESKDKNKINDNCKNSYEKKDDPNFPEVPEEPKFESLLNKDKIKIQAEIDDVKEEKNYRYNIGPIEPFDSTDRVDHISENIHKEVREDNKEIVDEYKKEENNIRVVREELI